MPRGADAVVMVEHADVRGGELRIARAVDRGQRRLVRRHRHHRGRDGASSRPASDEPRHRRAGRDRRRARGRVAQADRRDPFDRRRDHRARRADAAGEGLRLERADSRRRRARTWRRADAAGNRRTTTWRRCANGFSRRSRRADIVLLSGGTSKGAGDVSYRVVAELNDPGIVAHGVALKPGKPICLAATRGVPVVVLPGFPTSAIFTFHEFVAPVIRAEGRPALREPSHGDGATGRQSEQRDRPHGVLAREPGGNRGRADRKHVACGIPDGSGIRKRDHLQPRRRFHDHWPARRDRRSGNLNRCARARQ